MIVVMQHPYVQTAQHLVSYFSGKSLKFMPPDALILAQNAPKMRLAVGLRPDPGGAYSAVSGQKPLGQNPLEQNPLGQKPTKT